VCYQRANARNQKCIKCVWKDKLDSLPIGMCLIKNQCNTTLYIRLCTHCDKITIYHGRLAKNECISGINQDRKCPHCRQLGRKGKRCTAVSLKKWGETKSKNDKIINPETGLTRAEEYSIKKSAHNKLIGLKPPSGKGRKQNEELRKRRREISINYRKKLYVHSGKFSCYNQKAILIIESYGKEHGYIFRHAENHHNGEFQYRGFFADGYDEQQNVWIEYDERYHFVYNVLKHADVIRQIEIMKYLKCKFIRIKYDGTITIHESNVECELL